MKICQKDDKIVDGNTAAELGGIHLRIRARTNELAVLAGRLSYQITRKDYEQAKAEFAYEDASDS